MEASSEARSALEPPPSSAKGERNRIGTLRLLTGPLRRLPDFIIVGTQKSGTTALFKYLEAHPRTRLPVTKEIHFFDHHFRRGLNWYQAHFPLGMTREGPSRTGEASPSYFLHPSAPRRILEAAPRAKLIVLFRNPAERAYSHYQHNVRKGREDREFDQVLDLEEARIGDSIDRVLDDEDYFRDFARYSYLLRGIYVDQLRRWLDVFPRAQLLVLHMDALLKNPASTFKQTLDFLDLDDWEPEYRLHHTYGYEGMDPKLRDRLICFFRPHNQRLFDLLGETYDWG